MNALKAATAHTFFRLWPLNFGLDRAMALFNPPVPSNNTIVRKLRGFPLKLKFKPNSYMGRFLHYRRMYEDGIIQSLATCLRPGMTFVDIGANVGLYSTIAAHIVGPTGQVIAVEPQVELLEILHSNIRRNSMHNVRVEATALGRSSGSGALHQVSSNDGQATLRLGERESAIGTTVRVSIRRLDDLLDSLGVAEVDVMKIDVEGAEHEVLVGFERFLAERPPRVIFVECIGRHLRRFDSSALELVDLLVSYDYDVFRMSKGKWHRLGPGVRLDDDFAADIMAVHRTAASAAA